MTNLLRPLIPIREPNGVLAMVMVVVGIITMHAALLNARRRSLQSPVELMLAREIGFEVIGPEVAAVITIQVMAVVAGAEAIGSGIIDGDEKLVEALIILAFNIEAAGNGPVVMGTGHIEMDMGVFGVVAAGVDLFVFGLVTVVGG